MVGGVTEGVTHPPAVFYISVDPENVGQRIDNFLFNYLKGVPKSRVYRLIRRGEARVNSGRVKPLYRLRPGDRIRVPPIRHNRTTSVPTGYSDALGEHLDRSVVYEDDYIIVVDKPSGVAAHGGSGVSLGVIEAMRLQRKTRYLELVHRLDRDTSGCLMLAKRRSALRALHEFFRVGAVKKSYWALLKGELAARASVDLPLEKRVRGGERVVEISKDGMESRTEFRALDRYRDATLVEVNPITGRTHQIRVHATAMGYPIAGDTKYGDREFNRLVMSYGLRRLFLHASELRLPSLNGGEALRLAAPLSPDLQSVLGRMNRAEDVS